MPVEERIKNRLGKGSKTHPTVLNGIVAQINF